MFAISDVASRWQRCSSVASRSHHAHAHAASHSLYLRSVPLRMCVCAGSFIGGTGGGVRLGSRSEADLEIRIAGKSTRANRYTNGTFVRSPFSDLHHVSMCCINLRFAASICMLKAQGVIFLPKSAEFLFTWQGWNYGYIQSTYTWPSR